MGRMKRMIPVYLSLLVAVLSLCCSRVDAADTPDLAHTAITLAPIQEPGVDQAQLGAKLDALTESARQAIKGLEQAEDIIAALSKTLLSGRSVSYLSNRYWRDSTLAACVLRNQGNCLSTTTLFAIIGQRLELPIYGAVVPGHALAVWKDKDRLLTIETTNAGQIADFNFYRNWLQYSEADIAGTISEAVLSAEQYAVVLQWYAARHLADVKQVPAATALMKTALEAWPENNEIKLDYIGLLYTNPHTREQALAAYQQLTRLESASIATEAGLALWGHQQNIGATSEALSGYRSLLRYAPRTHQGRILSAMASCYRSLRQFNEAAISAELAIALTPIPQEGAWVSLAIMYKNADRMQDAIRALRQAQQENPEDPHTLLILAGYLAKAGDDEASTTAFNRIIPPKVNPRHWQTNLAWYYAARNNKDKFLHHIEAALLLAETPHFLSYIDTEVDFDPYRSDPDFQKLIQTHSKRLRGNEDTP